MAERAGGLDRAALSHDIRRRSQGTAHVRSLAVLDAEGRWLADSRDPDAAIHPPEAGRAPDPGRDDLRWHREHPGTALHVGTQRPDRLQAGSIIPISRRFTRPDGSFGGIVVAAFDPSVLQEVYDGVRLASRSAIVVWREDGRLLVRRPAVGLTDHSFADTDHFRALTAGGRAIQLFEMPGAIDGMRRFTGHERLARHPSLILSVGVGLDDIVEAWRSEALIEGSALGLAVLALIGLGIGLKRRQCRIRAAERDAVDAEKLFRALFDHSTDGLFVHRIEPDGTVRLEALNGRAAGMLGRPADDLAGKALPDNLPPDLYVPVAADLDATIRGGQRAPSSRARATGRGPASGRSSTCRCAARTGGSAAKRTARQRAASAAPGWGSPSASGSPR